MTNQRRLAILFVLLLTIVTLVFPQPVAARTIFQKIGRGIRKTVKFVVTLPDKSTRWMGPVLGPIAANVLSANLSQSSKIGKIFIKAHKAQSVIDQIDKQHELIGELKTAYRDQAQELTTTADQLRTQRKDLASQLVQGDLTYDDYLQRAVALEKLAQSYDKVAAEFLQKSSAIDEGTILKLVGQNALKLLSSKVKSAVLFELKSEIGKLIRTDVIARLLGDDLASSDLLIDMLVEGDLNEFVKAGGAEGVDLDALRVRLRDKIKELAKEGRDDLKANWQEKIKEALAQLSDEMKQDRQAIDETKAGQQQDTGQTDGDRCPTGYEWDTKVGKCKQSNCNDIEHAHWSYTVDCVCGSSGSVAENPEDPNKECAYSREYQSCPGCVYACVHLDEDCPLEGIGGY